MPKTNFVKIMPHCHVCYHDCLETKKHIICNKEDCFLYKKKFTKKQWDDLGRKKNACKLLRRDYKAKVKPQKAIKKNYHTNYIDFATWEASTEMIRGWVGFSSYQGNHALVRTIE